MLPPVRSLHRYTIPYRGLFIVWNFSVGCSVGLLLGGFAVVCNAVCTSGAGLPVRFVGACEIFAHLTFGKVMRIGKGRRNPDSKVRTNKWALSDGTDNTMCPGTRDVMLS